MKRFHILLIASLTLFVGVAVGYSDSHEIKKDSIQADRGISSYAMTVHQAAFSAELPVPLTVTIPDIGRPASNYVMVSEELTGVLKMCIRPPPEKVQKSEYNNIC